PTMVSMSCHCPPTTRRGTGSATVAALVAARLADSTASGQWARQDTRVYAWAPAGSRQATVPSRFMPTYWSCRSSTMAPSGSASTRTAVGGRTPVLVDGATCAAHPPATRVSAIHAPTPPRWVTADIPTPPGSEVGDLGEAAGVPPEELVEDGLEAHVLVVGRHGERGRHRHQLVVDVRVLPPPLSR